MIKGLVKPGLAERGKIKIGMKGAVRTSAKGNEFQPPQKLDHFIVTTLKRGPDGNFLKDERIHERIGDTPTRLPVRLLFNDPELNFRSRLACFVGRTMWCSGDGEVAMRQKNGGFEQVACPCERIEQNYKGTDKCKPNGALSLIIDGVPNVGSVWTFRTTSWNSIRNLESSMHQILALSGGVLAGLPLELVLQPKEVTTPDGKMMTAYIVSIEYPGTIDALRDIGYRMLEAEKTHEMRMRHVEDTVRRHLALPAPSNVPLNGDEVDDVVEEFYPEAISTPLRKSYTQKSMEAFLPPNEIVTSVPLSPGGDEDSVPAVSVPPTKQPAAVDFLPRTIAESDLSIDVYDEFGEIIAQFPRTNRGAIDWSTSVSRILEKLKTQDEIKSAWENNKETAENLSRKIKEANAAGAVGSLIDFARSLLEEDSNKMMGG